MSKHEHFPPITCEYATIRYLITIQAEMTLLTPSPSTIQVPACVEMAKGPLDPNRLLGKVQDAYTNPKTNVNFNTQPIEPSEGTSTSSYSKSLQKSGSGKEDFFYAEDLYRDTLSLEDFGSW